MPESDLQLGIIDLPEGAFFDKKDILRAADGQKLPDGLYRAEDGELILYEGNFENMIIDS